MSKSTLLVRKTPTTSLSSPTNSPQGSKAPVSIRRPNQETVAKTKAPAASTLMERRLEVVTIKGQYVSQLAYDYVKTFLPPHAIAVLGRSIPLDPSGDEGTQRPISKPHVAEYTTSTDNDIRAGTIGIERTFYFNLDIDPDDIQVNNDGTCEFVIDLEMFLEYLDGQHGGEVFKNITRFWRESRDDKLVAAYHHFLFEMVADCTIYINLDLHQKRELFRRHNALSKRVSGAHNLTLQGSSGVLASPEQVAFEAVKLLQHLDNQPFNGRINFLTNANKSYPISAPALTTSIVNYLSPQTATEGAEALVDFFAPIYDAFRGDKRLFSAAIFNGLLHAQYRGLHAGLLSDPDNIAKLVSGDGLDRFTGMNGGGAVTRVADIIVKIILPVPSPEPNPVEEVEADNTDFTA